jgi:hypothetical protein
MKPVAKQINVFNVVVEWLTLLFRIRKFTSYILTAVTAYPDWGFSWFSSVLPGKCRDSTLKLGHDHFLPNHFQFIIIQLSSYHRHYTVWLLKKRR